MHDLAHANAPSKAPATDDGEAGNPLLAKLGVAGPNMEGKEVRFGIADSTIWATATTDASEES